MMKNTCSGSLIDGTGGSSGACRVFAFFVIYKQGAPAGAEVELTLLHKLKTWYFCSSRNPVQRRTRLRGSATIQPEQKYHYQGNIITGKKHLPMNWRE